MTPLEKAFTEMEDGMAENGNQAIIDHLSKMNAKAHPQPKIKISIPTKKLKVAKPK